MFGLLDEPAEPAPSAERAPSAEPAPKKSSSRLALRRDGTSRKLSVARKKVAKLAVSAVEMMEENEEFDVIPPEGEEPGATVTRPRRLTFKRKCVIGVARLRNFDYYWRIILPLIYVPFILFMLAEVDFGTRWAALRAVSQTSCP